MHNRLFPVVCVLSLVAFAAVGFGAEPAPAAVRNLAATQLAQLGTDLVVVAAVKAENAKGKSLDEIKAADTRWQATAGVDATMQALIDSPCGRYLREWQTKNDYLAEIFVMDAQGANVAMTDKTSDYWQGDEAKFTESFAGGKGATHVSDVKFDESSQTYTVQISVPVMDGGKAIGAITFGIDVDKVD